MGGSNQCYGSVSLLQADLSHDSSLTFNAYSGDLIEDGELLAQKSELPARGIVPNGGAELYGSAADPRPLSKYIEEKYGRDCKLDCWTSLDYRGTTQQDFGNYLEERNGYWANAEPNCTLTACYNVFDYLAGAKPSIFPSAMKKTSPYDIRFEESAMYSYFLTMSVQKKLYKFRDGVERKYGEDYSALPVKNRTDLYRQVRSASFQTKTTWYSENPGGLDIWQTSQMAERVANVYDIQGLIRGRKSITTGTWEQKTSKIISTSALPLSYSPRQRACMGPIRLPFSAIAFTNSRRKCCSSTSRSGNASWTFWTAGARAEGTSTSRITTETSAPS